MIKNNYLGNGRLIRISAKRNMNKVSNTLTVNDNKQVHNLFQNLKFPKGRKCYLHCYNYTDYLGHINFGFVHESC